MSKRCQIVKQRCRNVQKMSKCQKDIKLSKLYQSQTAGLGRGFTKKKLTQ